MKIFKDKKGDWAIWQTPNLPLTLWFISTIAAKVFGDGDVHSFFSTVAFGAIFTWAYLEIRSGISTFRRALGVVVIIVSIYGQINK